MTVIRLAKIVMIAALAVFALLVAYNNVFDYNFDDCCIGFHQPA